MKFMWVYRLIYFFCCFQLFYFCLLKILWNTTAYFYFSNITQFLLFAAVSFGICFFCFHFESATQILLLLSLRSFILLCYVCKLVLGLKGFLKFWLLDRVLAQVRIFLTNSSIKIMKLNTIVIGIVWLIISTYFFSYFFT